MTDDNRLPLRLACDRCHTQKLRCPKRPGVEACDRCAKARTSCVHSPIKRKVPVQAEPIPVIAPTSLLPYGKHDEPIGTKKSPTNVTKLKRKRISTPPRTTILGHGFDSPFSNAQDEQSGSNALAKFGRTSFLADGTSDDFNFEDINPNPLNHHLLHSISSQPTYAASTIPSLAVLDQDFDPLFRLAELNIGLHKHSKEMPPPSIYDSGLPSSDNIHETAKYKMEDIFRLTQDLVDIYPLFTRMFFQSSTWTSQQTQDPSAIFTLFSCHLRLIDITSIFLKHVQVWISSGGKPCSFSPDAKYNPPLLAVGSFILPQTSALPLQMLVFIQLASQLSQHAGNLFEEMEIDEKVRGQDGAARVTAELVRKRAYSMVQELERLRDGMLQLGFIV